VTPNAPGQAALLSHTPGVRFADAVWDIMLIDRSDTVSNVTTIGSKTLRELLAFNFFPPLFWDYIIPISYVILMLYKAFLCQHA
jgi:hypothetical protein